MKGNPDGDPQPVYEAERGPKQESERHHRQRPDTILQLLGGDNGDQSQIEPTERSMPPVRMTKVMPTATIPMIETCRATLSRFPGWRK